MTLQTAIMVAFAAACVAVWIAAIAVLLTAAFAARALAQRAKRILPDDLRERARVARIDVMRAKTAFAQLGLVAVRARIAATSIRRSLAVAQIVFRGLPSPSWNGRTR